ncbi:glycosyltransferase family 4 protein [Flavobacterium sp.]|uniref:glycosyltransferase family 4 protein n=1 Tax=Flavobacterium sp. TaxID=239 RepID=UPI002FDCB880
MKLAIITHVIHGKESGHYFGYEPYVREMNLWLKFVSDVTIVAPLENIQRNSIHDFYQHHAIHFTAVPAFHFITPGSRLKALWQLPKIMVTLYKAMAQADHIHLRCPGNMGLLGCLVQLFFPSKPKTAKYAGNWDPNARQPLSYRLQKWILSNPFLTKNMQVLVYGEWENSTQNIKPFFTASYFEKDKEPISPKSLTGKLRFLFVGTLSNGKQPLYAVRLVESLQKKGYEVSLEVYGEGAERNQLEAYIAANNLENVVFLKGNQNQQTLKEAYQKSHFVILPSLSEGWPKVIAEGMFWGCLPIASKVSCVPFMLDYGNRGIILDFNLDTDVNQIAALCSEPNLYQSKVRHAVDWSRQYTMDVFEEQIKQLVQQ